MDFLTEPLARKLDWSRKFVLNGAKLLTFSMLAGFALLRASPSHGQSAQPAVESLPAFDVASVKITRLAAPGSVEGQAQTNITANPDNLIIRNSNLHDCIEWAYRLKNYQVLGPNWLDTEKYDIWAKADHAVTEGQIRRMLQRLLAERFHLVLHHDQKYFPVYVLVAGKKGPKLRESAADSSSIKLASPGLRFVFQKEPLSQLADTLSTLVFVDRPVIDGTGQNTAYDFTLDLRELTGAGGSPAQDSVPGPSIFTILSEQLGLTLEPRKAPLDVVVVDHAERVPTEN